MSDSPAPHRILDRIQKLMALAESSNEHEAANAAARAAELMAQYQVTEAVLVDEAALEPIEEFTLDEAGRFMSWKCELGGGIAQAFGCDTYLSSERKMGWRQLRNAKPRRTVVVGRRADVDTVRYMYAYLTREVNRLADRAWRQKRRESPDYGNARSWKNGFRFGAASVIVERLIASRSSTLDKARRTPSAQMALQRIDAHDRALRDYMARMNLGRGRQVAIGNSDGFVNGAVAGRDVNLGNNQRLRGPAPRLKPKNDSA